MPPLSRRLVLLYALSGAVGLSWQVLWVRAFTPVFGAGLEAIAAVTAVFMGGLGLGAHLSTRALGRWPALRLYAGLEALVGLWGLLLPWVLGAADPAVTAMLVAAGPGLGAVVVRLLVALVLVGPPAVLLGGTFPAVAVALGAERDQSVVGLAYGVNALGAALGALAAGLWLPWALGLRAGSALLGGLNVVVGAIAWRMPASPPPPAAPPVAAPAHGPWLLAVVTGFVGMALEVCWSRLSGPLLAARFGADAVAFAVVLAAVVSGIGIGGLLARRRPDPHGLHLAVAQAGLCVFTLLCLEPARDLVLGGNRFEGVEALLPLVPALFLGASFPLLSNNLLGRGASVQAALPRLYALNTAGGVAGSLLAGFWLVPVLGAQRLAVGLALTAGLVALGLLVAAGRRAPAIGWGLVGGTLVAVTGAAAAPVAGGRLLPPYEIAVAALEGRDGSTLISTRPEGGERTLTSSGHRIGAAATGGGVDDHALRALAPARLHSAPKRVLLVGLGTGATSRAFLSVPTVETLVVVELDTNQRRLLPWFGTDGIEADPRLRIVDGDGRRFVRQDQGAWDVIAIDAYDPKTASATFYTREFYEEARARLAPGGLLWVKFNPAALTDDQVLGGFLQTLFDVFPDGALVYLERGLFGLVGVEAGSVRLPDDKVVADARSMRGRDDRRHTDDRPLRVVDRAGPAFDLLTPYWEARGRTDVPPWAPSGRSNPRPR